MAPDETTTPEPIEMEASQAVARAELEIQALRNGDHEWRMHSPADFDDSDVILSILAVVARTALSDRERLTRELEASRRMRDGQQEALIGFMRTCECFARERDEARGERDQWRVAAESTLDRIDAINARLAKTVSSVPP